MTKYYHILRSSRWVQKFKEDRDTTTDEHHCGRPDTVTDEVGVKKIRDIPVLKSDRDELASVCCLCMP